MAEIVYASSPEVQRVAEDFARAEGVDPKDLSMIDQFKDRARAFADALDSLKRRATVAQSSPAFKAEYDALLSRGDYIKAAIKTAMGAVDKVTEFFGLSGLNGMGFIPLIPIAAITAALAAITKWVSDVYTFNKKLDAIDSYVAQGLTPQQAAGVVAKAMPSGLFGGLDKLLPILAVGGLLFLWMRSRQ